MWGQTAAALSLFIVALLVPGWAALLALGIRGVAAVAGAPAVTLGLVAIATVLLPAIGVPWSVAAVAVYLIVVIGALAAVGVVVVRRRRAASSERSAAPRDGRTAALGFLVGAVAGAVLLGVRLVLAIGSPDNISQTFDNIFHLNAVRYILDSGDASPFHLSSLTFDVDGLGSFYPGLWHSLAALLVQGGGVDIPVAANVIDLTLACLVWPFSCMLLMRQLLGPRAVALAATGILASCSALFPYLLLDFGVLTPNALSVAALPAALAWTVVVLGLAREPHIGRIAALAAAAATVIGVALAHPSSVFALMFLAAPAAVVAIARWWRATAGDPRARWLGGAGILVAAALVLLAFWWLRPTREAAFWGPSMSYGDAVWSILAGSEAYRGAAPALTIAAVAGVVALLVWRRQRWLVVSLALLLLLYVTVAAVHVGRFRYLLTGTWYSDIFRIAALLPVVGIPLAVIGCLWLGELIAAAIGRARRGSPAHDAADMDGSSGGASAPPPATGRLAGVLGGSVAVILAALSQAGPALAGASGSIAAIYATTPDSMLLTTDERRMLDRVPAYVDPDGVIAGNPWTGASLAYAISDRRTLVPHIFSALGDDQVLIIEGLDTAAAGDEVCAAVERLGVTHALDFGTREVHGGDHVQSGFDRLAESDAVELVAREGSVGLYRIIGCD